MKLRDVKRCGTKWCAVERKSTRRLKRGAVQVKMLQYTHRYSTPYLSWITSLDPNINVQCPVHLKRLNDAKRLSSCKVRPMGFPFILPLSLYYAHRRKRADINLICFGYITRLSHAMGRRGYLLVQMISTCLRCVLRGGGGQHPVCGTQLHKDFVALYSYLQCYSCLLNSSDLPLTNKKLW